MAQILDGVRVRDAILDECRPRVAALRRPPGLAVVLVCHNPASEIYVRNKVKACADLGIYSETLTPPDSVSTAELLAMIGELNRRPAIDGIFVQMPLPPPWWTSESIALPTARRPRASSATLRTRLHRSTGRAVCWWEMSIQLTRPRALQLIHPCREESDP